MDIDQTDAAEEVPYIDQPPADEVAPFEEQYEVPFEHYALPPIDQLHVEFPGSDNVSGIFDGRPFFEHGSREGLSRKPGVRVMLVKSFQREVSTEEAISEMFGLGWRPANQIGTYWLSRLTPDLQRSFWIIGLGAYAIGAGNNLVTVLSGGSDWRALGSRDIGTKWSFRIEADDPRHLIAKKLFLFERVT